MFLSGAVAVFTPDPVVEHVSTKPFVPNDASFDHGVFLQVMTGANNSGKSTFLQQVALITIMAHVGCYVPAKQATIPLLDIGAP